MSSLGASGAEPASSARPRSVRSFLPFLGVAVVLSVLGLLTTTPLAGDWFADGPHIEWTPQIWVYTAVWTVVYVLDAVAGWLLWSGRDRVGASRAALVLYWVQIALQAVWLLGFMAQAVVSGASLWAVFAVIVLLDVVTVLGALSAWRTSRAAGVLLLLVLAWLLFGTALSGADTLLRTDLT